MINKRIKKLGAKMVLGFGLLKGPKYRKRYPIVTNTYPLKR
jgi:hypothetical protein